MCSFGEIVEPNSRTNWEDWDEFISNRDDRKLQWQNNIEIIETIDFFYFISGKYLSQCIQKQSHRLELLNSVIEINLYLYKIKSQNKYLCTLKDYDVVLSSEIVKLLQPYFETCKNVITLQSNPMSEYQIAQLHTQSCVIRGIYTSKVNNLPDFEFPKLEQPNILSGVAAGVITLREQLDLPGVALIFYTNCTEDHHVEELQKLLNKLEIVSNQQVGLAPELKSNLYI